PAVARREPERGAEPPHVFRRAVQERDLWPRRLVARLRHLRPAAPGQLRSPVPPARNRVAVSKERISVDLREHADRDQRAREPAVFLPGHLAPRRIGAEPGRTRRRLRLRVRKSRPVAVGTVRPPELEHLHRRWRPASHVENPLPRILTACERGRSEEHTSELQSREKLVCRLLLEKKKNNPKNLRSRHITG